LGMSGTRKVRDFCNQSGDDNPFRDNNKAYKAMDALRLSAYNHMASVYKQQKKWNKVIQKCSKVLEENGMDIKALLNRGSAYRHLKQFEKAKEDLMKVQNSKIVWIDIEMEMNSLNKNISGKYSDNEEEEMSISSMNNMTFKNDNYPQLPLRNILFEQWLNNNNDQTVQYEILYPVPNKKPYYKLYTNQEQLDMAIQWLDVEVAEKLINLKQFDVNQQTYLNQLCTGLLNTNLKYDANKERFMKLVTILCEHDDIDLENRDEKERTALANVVKHQMIDLGTILLKYGADVNHGSVRKEIGQNESIKSLIKRNLSIIRKNNMNAIEQVMSTMYAVQNDKICKTILDFTISECNNLDVD